jgi:hypothetical protein
LLPFGARLAPTGSGPSAGPMTGSAVRRSQVSRRCRLLIAAAVAAVALTPVLGAAQTPDTGTGAGLTPDIGAGPAPGATITPSTMTQSTIPDPNAPFLEPSLQGNPANPPRFRQFGATDDQTPPAETFTAPSRIGATPIYGSAPAFGAGDTGFDSMNLSKSKKKKLQAQAPPPPGPGVETPQTTFDPIPSTQFAVPPVPPAQPAAPPPEIYPTKAANRPGAVLPPLLEPLPVSNPAPEVHPLAAATRPGASLPVPPPIDLDDSASTPMPGTQPLNTYPLGTPAQRPPPIADGDPYAPIGIRGGSLMFFPSVELSAGYDNNPQHIPGGASSMYFVVAPELQVQSDWSRHSLTADIRGSYMDYTNDSFQPTLSRPYLNSTIDGRIDVTHDTQLLLENRVLVTTQNPGSPNLPAGLADLPIVTTVGGTFGIVENFNRLLVSLKGLVDRSEFQDSKLTDGETSSNADENFNQYAAVARVGYEIDPGLKPFVELQEDERIHDEEFDRNGEQRNSVGTSVKLGGTLDLFSTLKGEIAFGYLNRTYQDPNLPAVNGPTLDGTLTWQATALTTAKLTASSMVNESILQGVSGSLSRDVNVEVDHALRRWLVLNGIVGYGRDEYVGLGRDDNRYFVSAGATYKFNPEIWLKGEVRHDWLTSNFSGVAYDSTSVLFTLRLQR